MASWIRITTFLAVFDLAVIATFARRDGEHRREPNRISHVDRDSRTPGKGSSYWAPAPAKGHRNHIHKPRAPVSTNHRRNDIPRSKPNFQYDNKEEKDLGNPSMKNMDEEMVNEWDKLVGKASGATKTKTDTWVMEEDEKGQKIAGEDISETVSINGAQKQNLDDEGQSDLEDQNSLNEEKVQTGRVGEQDAADTRPGAMVPIYETISKTTETGLCWVLRNRTNLLITTIVLLFFDLAFIAFLIYRFRVRKGYQELSFGYIRSLGELVTAIDSLDYEQRETVSKFFYHRLRAMKEFDIMKIYYGKRKDQFAEGLGFTKLVSDLKDLPPLWRQRKLRASRKNFRMTPSDLESSEEERFVAPRSIYRPKMPSSTELDG